MNSALRHKGTALKPRPPAVDPEPPAAAITIGLNAAVVAVRGDEPMIAVALTPQGEMLPSALFCARTHSSLESGLRQCVARQTGLELGYIQQLGAFERWLPTGAPTEPDASALVLSLCYLALVGPGHGAEQEQLGAGATWRSWYDFFPWEDWRSGKPACLADEIEPRLKAWAARPAATNGSRMALDRGERLRLSFGFGGTGWDEEKVAERYALLNEAGVIGAAPSRELPAVRHPLLGAQGHMLAAAIGELRRMIKCRAAVFELMPELFTLFELQKTVEALLGPHLHKQNFRRLVESGGLVEPTGSVKQRTGGRPAQLYRFRRDVLLERLAPGVRVKSGRP